MDIDCVWLPGILIHLSQLLLELDLAFVEECVRAQSVFLLLLQMLLILSNVVFHADFCAGVYADFDVALVAADVLYLKLDGPVMVFCLNLDCVRPHDTKLY